MSGRIDVRRSSGALALGALLLALAAPAGAVAQPWSARLLGPLARSEVRHPEALVRIDAARRLGRFGEPHRAVAALAEALEAEEDPRVRPAILDALARRGDEGSVPRIAQRLGDLGREDRAAALRAIGAIGGESAVRVLVEWLPAPDVGEDAAAALIRIGAPAVPHVLRALRQPPAAERAARVLGAIGDARATPALVGALEASPAGLRIAAIEALAALGDERAVPAVARSLSDSATPVVDAALVALARLGGPELAPVLAEIADGGAPAQRALALLALVRTSPETAAPRVEAILADASAPAALQSGALRAIVAHPAAAFVPALSAAARDPARRAEAADALARTPGGAGMEALAALASEGGLELELAVGLRRHEPTLPASTLARARALLGDGSSIRSALALALARDPRALAPLVTALGAPEPTLRAEAALGLALLGPLASPAAERLTSQLAAEDDPRAFRAMAAAASALGARVDPAALDVRWWSADTAPEALWLAAESYRGASARTRRRVRRAMRRALRSHDARVRAGAALALARAGDDAAWRALAATLDDEHDAVRLASARALASSAPREARAALAARERVERDDEVRAALRAALDAGEGRPPPPSVHGDEVLFVRVVTAPGVRRRAEGERIEVDVVLPDGRWLRTFAIAGGEVVVPDLPAGDAEVQVRL